MLLRCWGKTDIREENEGGRDREKKEERREKEGWKEGQKEYEVGVGKEREWQGEMGEIKQKERQAKAKMKEGEGRGRASAEEEKRGRKVHNPFFKKYNQM